MTRMKQDRAPVQPAGARAGPQAPGAAEVSAVITRPCCGATGSLAAFYRGSVRIPHRRGCKGVQR